MLPPVKAYLSRELKGTRNVRVKDQANTLHVTTWLHHLDLTTTYGRSVLESPNAGDYNMGPLLEYFLVPKTSGLTFKEIARRVTQENRQDAKSSLQELLRQREELWQAVEYLVQSRDREPNKEAKKSLKKRLDSTRKELRSLESQISQQELLLGHRRSGDAAMVPPHGTDLDVIVESETVKIVEGGDTQSEGTTQESTTGPPEGEQEQPMETNPLDSPVSPNEDDLLTGTAAAGVEMELASLRVTSSPEGEEGHQEASG